MDALAAAVLAVNAAERGDRAAAEAHLSTAAWQARTAARRHRQVIEIAALVVADHRTRAAGLAAVHAEEFPEDAEVLAQVTARPV